MKGRERSFELESLRLAAVEWGREGDVPAIALHGWLDNAASFDLLAPLLGGLHLVALDCAGHGKSGFRSADSSYGIWQDVGEIVAVADQLGWQRFSLIGHSRGAAIATLVAGTFPGRVERLVLHEGGIPLLGNPLAAAEDLARSIAESKALAGRAGRSFRTREEAIEERARGFSKVSAAAAEVLARRALIEDKDGFRWHADQRLKATSPLKLTAEQVGAFVARVECPVLAFLADDSPFAQADWFRSLMRRFDRIEIEQLPGGHHCHLEGAEALMAPKIRSFFGLGTA